MLIRYAFSIEGIEKSEIAKELIELLSKKRREKVERFRFEADKVRSVFAELLLRYGLKKHYSLSGSQIEFEWNEFGKPSLKNQKELYFNISHSGNWVICAISNDSVGVDVEQINPKNLDIAKRFYAKDEYEQLLKSEKKDELFIWYWTLKESYVKAVGKGMTIDFSSISFSEENGEIQLLVEEKLCTEYRFEVITLEPGYLAATSSRVPMEGDFIKLSYEEILKVLTE